MSNYIFLVIIFLFMAIEATSAYKFFRLKKIKIGIFSTIYFQLSRGTPDSYFWSELKRMMIRLITEIYGSRMDFPEAELRLYAEYFVSGVMAVYLSWLQGELSLSFDELARLASEATFHGIRKSRKTGDGL